MDVDFMTNTILFKNHQGDLVVYKEDGTYTRIIIYSSVWFEARLDYKSNIWVRLNEQTNIYTTNGELIKTVKDRFDFYFIMLSEKKTKLLASDCHGSDYVYSFSDNYSFHRERKVKFPHCSQSYFYGFEGDYYNYNENNALLFKDCRNNNTTFIFYFRPMSHRNMGSGYWMITQTNNRNVVVNHKGVIKEIKEYEKDFFNKLFVRQAANEELIFYSVDGNKLLVY